MDRSEPPGDQPIGPDVFQHLIGGYQHYVQTIPATAEPARIERLLNKIKATDRLEIVGVSIE